MKKLSCIFLTSLLIFMVLSFVVGQRGYTKDNYDYRNNQFDARVYSRINELEEKWKESVVQILATRNNNQSLGTGFFINNDNMIVTNYHVIKEANKIFVILQNDDFAHEAEIVVYHIQEDLAVLKVKDKLSYKAIKIAYKTNNNAKVYTCGYGDYYSVTYGTVIDTKAYYKGNIYIDTTNVVKEGTSGGPAFNEKGEVVGIVTLGNSYSTSLVPSYKLMALLNGANIEYSI